MGQMAPKVAKSKKIKSSQKRLKFGVSVLHSLYFMEITLFFSMKIHLLVLFYCQSRGILMKICHFLKFT